jgi:hypothetical protein
MNQRFEGTYLLHYQGEENQRHGNNVSCTSFTHVSGELTAHNFMDKILPNDQPQSYRALLRVMEAARSSETSVSSTYNVQRTIPDSSGLN